MKSSQQLITTAMTSQRSALRQLHHIQRILAKSPAMAKADEDFDTAMEHFESVLDLLNEALLVPVENPPITTTTTIHVEPPKAAVTVIPEPMKVSAEDDPDEGTHEAHEPIEKGGVPIHDDLESVMRSIERVTDRLEQVKAKRAEESTRYPNGRPMSAERMAQVETLQTRLSRLKVSAEVSEQQQIEQQELQQMAERMKRFGAAV